MPINPGRPPSARERRELERIQANSRRIAKIQAELHRREYDRKCGIDPDTLKNLPRP